MMLNDQKNGKTSINDFTNISVIVAAKNEEKHIEKCIDSLKKQNFSGAYEIIVVDNCSEDKTRELAEGKGVFVVGCEGRSPAAVRNFGASLAKYDILAFIDGDCEAPKSWLSCALKNLSNSNVHVTGGGCLSPKHSNFIVKSWTPASIKRSPAHKYGALLPGSNFIIKKEIFNNLGGFNDLLISAEDDDFCKRVMAAGFSILSDDNMKVIHHGYPSTLKEVYFKSIWHGSTQLKAHGLFGDRMVVLTWAWILVFFVFVFNLFIGSYSFLLTFFIIFFLLPLLLCFARLKRFILKDKIKYFFILYLVSLVVLFGRSLGIIREISSGIFKKETIIQQRKQ